jgi:exopolyphosphatase/guanosine-5'-triphosphate,3'-diphosphate pyrophosphatase
MGAGSLDISLLKKGFTLTHMGLALGALRFKQILSRVDGSREELAEALQEYIANEFAYFKSRLPRVTVDDIFIIDENQEYLKAVLPNKKVATNFFQFSLKDVEPIIKELTAKGADEIAEDYDLPLESADTLLPYMSILKMFFGMIENPHVYILETSLAEAVLANKVLGLELSKRYNKSNQLISVAHAICEQYNVNIEHAKSVAHLSRQLFEGLAPHLGLEESELLYLVLAAYLHDIGKFISNRSHHKHSEYIINSLNLFRLTDEEIRIIAAVARYHRRGEPSKSHLIYNSLSEEKQIVVQKLASLLRIANALDHTHLQKVKGLAIEGGGKGELTLVVNTRENFLLERADFNEKKELFERITGSHLKMTINEDA